jgi:hypothetical protein
MPRPLSGIIETQPLTKCEEGWPMDPRGQAHMGARDAYAASIEW